MPADPTPAETAEPCGAWPPYLDGHNYPCTEPAGHDGQHRNDSLHWSGPTPPPVPRMSTDFPGQPFGRGDTITVITGGCAVCSTQHATIAEAQACGKVAPAGSAAASVSDTGMYLDAARVYCAASTEIGGTDPTAAAPLLAAHVPFRAAVDAARAPLLAELAEARAEAQRFHAQLEADGFVAYTRSQVDAWWRIEAERDRLRVSLAGAVAANDTLAAELAEAHAETERLRDAEFEHAGCAGLRERDNAELIRQRDHARDGLAALRAAVRRIHFPYRAGTVDYMTCAGCNTAEYCVPWPCRTIEALDETEASDG